MRKITEEEAVRCQKMVDIIALELKTVFKKNLAPDFSKYTDAQIIVILSNSVGMVLDWMARNSHKTLNGQIGFIQGVAELSKQLLVMPFMDKEKKAR